MLSAYPLSESDALSVAATLSPQLRRCLVCGEVSDKAEMIRFVLDPDHNVVPDVAARLPGRGLWVRADRALLTQGVVKNMFARSAKQKVRVPENLVELTQQLLARRCRDLLGLARGAGVLVLGQPQIEQALRADALSCLILAQDAGRDCRKKLARARLVPSGFTRDELGIALGYDQLAAVGLKPHALAAKLEKECARWQGVSGRQQDLTEDNEIAN